MNHEQEDSMASSEGVVLKKSILCGPTTDDQNIVKKLFMVHRRQTTSQ